MRRRLAALPALTALAAGCGGGAPGALSETADNLSELRSGTLDAALVIRAEGMKGGDVGFRLAGPFALPRRRGDLPAARIAYTQIAGPRRATLRLVSAPEGAFARVRGAWYRLPPGRVRGLAAIGPPGEASGRLPIEDWIRDPKLERRGRLDRITGDLDVGAAVDGLLGVAERLGGVAGLRPLGEEGRRALERAARRADVEVLTGHEDRLLRSLRLDVRLETATAAAGSLGRLRGARIAFRLAVARPNRPVRVRPPRGAREYAALAGSP